MQIGDTAMEHIAKAMNSLEMIKMLAETPKYKKLNVEKRISQYYKSLVESVLALQDAVVEDQEYTEDLQLGIHTVSKGREYSLQLTENYAGDVFYSLDAMLPLKEMKRHALFQGRRDNVVTIS